MLSTSRPWVRRSRRPQRNTLKSCAGNNYAILAISQLKLKLMGKEEFLQSRMACLQDTIAQAKAGVVEKDTLSKHIPRPPSPPRRRPRTTYSTPLRRPTNPRRTQARETSVSSSPRPGPSNRVDKEIEFVENTKPRSSKRPLLEDQTLNADSWKKRKDLKKSEKKTLKK